MGVWIEMTADYKVAAPPLESLPSWECGLKSSTGTTGKGGLPSLPSWECGLKLMKLEKKS